MKREEIIKKITEYSLDDLANQENYQELFGEINNPNLEVVDCYLIARALGDKLNSLDELKQAEYKKVRDNYLEIISFFKLRCFMNLPVEEAGEFMKTMLVKANRVNIREEFLWDFMENLYVSLDSIYDLDGNKREVMLEKIKQNEEWLGNQKLNFAGQGSPQEPYLKLWLKDYDINSKSEGGRTALERLNYLNGSESAKQLDPTEKKLLTLLLEVYDALRFFKPKPVERRTADYWEAQAAKLGGGEISGNSKEDLVALYKQIKQDLLTGDFETTLDNLKQQSPQNLAKATESFALDGNQIGALAGITALVSQGNLEDFVKSSEKIQVELKDSLSGRFSSTLINQLNFNDLEPPLLSLILQFILTQKLKLSLDRSAVFVMHLANLLPKGKENKLIPLAYGQVKAKQFQWRSVAEENGKLIFK